MLCGHIGTKKYILKRHAIKTCISALFLTFLSSQMVEQKPPDDAETKKKKSQGESRKQV